MIRYLAQIESETITEQAIKIDFDFSNRESIPDGEDPGDSIIINPITCRTWFRIRPLLLQIDEEDLGRMIEKQGVINENLPEIMDKYGELLIDIVCLGIHNRKSEPPAWFRDVLIDNSTWEDIRILLNAIIYRIGYFPFCNSITTLANVSPLRTEAEIIAAQKNLMSWQDSVKQDS